MGAKHRRAELSSFSLPTLAYHVKVLMAETVNHIRYKTLTCCNPIHATCHGTFDLRSLCAAGASSGELPRSALIQTRGELP